MVELASQALSESVGVTGTRRQSRHHRTCQAGSQIGGYSLLLPIGAGGMAQVWAAAPSGVGLARAVALKVILPEYGTIDEFERMFVDEAIVTSAVRHPNICQVHRLARDGEQLYMILELVMGSSLGRILRPGDTHQPLPLPIAVRVVSEACAGIHAAHEAKARNGEHLQIVHRDVSPANLLLSINGDVKVSDFGIAKAKYQLHTRTQTGQIKGKFAYIPPEQIAGKGVDRRADIYALGCMLYIATLGCRPFGTGSDALSRIVRGSYCLPSELQSDFPTELNDIIVKALQPDPQRRFQTAKEMRMALEKWLTHTGHVVLSSDIGKVVRERLSEDRLAVVQALMSSDRHVSDELAQRLLTPSTRVEAPTASQPPTRNSQTGPTERRDTDSPTWRPRASSAPAAEMPKIPAASPVGVDAVQANAAPLKLPPSAADGD